ncbi:MAG TPA: IspD/TarI family cytidylyltransferase [Streptosporangiaceae bacterium]|nr:IspD/TarI family cytidylyltransferase [Streptosporangiaceae bacterium]
MRTVAVVLAGGSGSRFGSDRPKQLRALAGRNLIEHCVRAFDQAPAVDDVLVVVAPDIEDEVRQAIAGYRKVAGVILGGLSRTDSTRQAIGWLTTGGRAGADPAEPGGPDMKVLFHDAARPLVDQQTIADVVTALDQWLAVGVVVPSSDTIVEVADGAIRRVLARDALARCQTPQGFRLSVIRRAYELADADPGFAAVPATDDCGVVLRYLPDVPVGVVRGSERNLKITYAADLAVAQALLDYPDGTS